MRRSHGPLLKSPIIRSAALLSGTLLTLLASRPARAALATEVASGGEKDHPVAVNLDLQYDYWQETARITRENPNSTIATPDVLNYQRTIDTMTLAARFGLGRDFELHAFLPWIISDQQNWTYTAPQSASVVQTVSGTYQNAHGDKACATESCTMFPVPGSVNRGGISDPTFGFAWAIFNDSRKSRLPGSWFPPVSDLATWVVGIDYTPPIVGVMTPAAGSGSSLPVGLGEHRIDFWTAMSKRVGMFEPFIRVHFLLPIAASNAYDNCNIVGKDPNQNVMAAYTPTNGQYPLVDSTWSPGQTPLVGPNQPVTLASEGQSMCNQSSAWVQTSSTLPASASCPSGMVCSYQANNPCQNNPASQCPYQPLYVKAANPFKGQTGLQPSMVGGVAMGTDFHPIDNGATGWGINISLQLNGEYVSKGRNYSELSDELQKLTFTDEYFDIGGQFGVDIRFAKWFHWVTKVNLTTYTPHLLTIESVGQDINGDGKVTLNTPEVNPNYDFRLDQPGWRFGIEGVTVVDFSTRLTANF